MSRFLNDKKSRIRCKFDQLANKLAQTCRDLLGSFYLIFYLKSTFVIHLFFITNSYFNSFFFIIL
ncbi:MAG TPA: PIN family toxin-antitoxin system [Fusobacterium sp.]|uniref:PIN family toxin-antitoxin system n=1 Tax=Fusobacterium nucleatum TaxID=851 RepID=A0A323TX70_FUSNU|nr:PIN family toxin-antitoxin system [Fusobacterium nucleatum]HCE32613.1 PIN family toxin-antitoxin system [Fusobacterium sp.]